jgi:predicted O-methyltransferase YrrM
MRSHAKELSEAFGYLRIDEVEALQTLAAMLPPNPKVINVGAGTGTSALSIREARPDAEITTVDISEGGPLGGLQNERNAFDKAKLPYPIQILGKSHEVAKEWDGGEVDMIFIDDGHSRSEIEGDILGWIKHLGQGGIMVFHDYDSVHWPDVKNVIDEYFQNSPYLAHVDTIIAFVV